MDVSFCNSWKNHLYTEFNKPYFNNLTTFVAQEYSNYRCYPPKLEIFEAFNTCSFHNLKVVIIGQDPYHGPNQAHGLCFSVNDSISHPPSLVNIFKELEQDIGKPYPESGNLAHWATQGVLLLNATLTVRENQAGSHQNKGWEQFSNTVIKLINETKEHIVFLLWGGFAKKKAKFIDSSKHFILESGHPSPLSANKGYWFGNKHFSKTNYLLEKVGKHPVDW